jgi:prevent-host-death family protein
MRSVNVRQLHERTGRLVDLAAQGHVLLIVRRGEPIAQLVPLTDQSARPRLPDRSRRLARFPAIATDTGRILERERS